MLKVNRQKFHVPYTISAPQKEYIKVRFLEGVDQDFLVKMR